MITHLQIRNFKSLDIDFSLAPVTVLIGRSGTGKTNFVEAIRFFRDFLRDRGGPSIHSRGGWPSLVSTTAPRPVSMDFEVQFSVPSVPDDFLYRVTLEQANPSGSEFQLTFEGLSLGGQSLFSHGRGVWDRPPGVVDPPPVTGIMLGAITGVQEIAIAHVALTQAVGCYSFTETVLLSGGTARLQGDTGLADDGSNYLQAFQAIVTNLAALHHWREIVSAVRRLNSSIKSVELQMPGRDRIAVSHEAGGKRLVLDLGQESEGLRRFLACLVALYQTPSKQALFLEEPEKGIHPGALAVLADEFKACPDAGRGQVILTTHSPELLNHFDPESLRVVELEDHVTHIGPVAPEQVEAVRDRLLKPGELLTVDYARLAPTGNSSR